MSRRMSLPGADELFRTTGTDGLALEPPPAEAAAPGASSSDAALGPLRAVTDAAARSAPAAPGRASGVRHTSARRQDRAEADRRPSGRERHDEKITVYVSAEELLELEQARLTLRAEHGMAVDRGRIVREAIAVVLADLDARGNASVLVRRLRGC
jgi:hypothetical protein